MERVKIVDILKEFQEGVDFTIESKKRVIFHNKKIVDYLELQQQEQGKAKWFYDFIRGFIPSAVCFYEEKENGNCVFTFKSGKNKKDRKQEIEKNFKENTGIDITYHGKNSNGGYVISSKFKNPEIEKQKNELIEESMGKRQVDKSKENLNQHFIDDGKGLTYSVEKKDEDKVIKESYYETGSEEEKKQIIERNKKKREEEKRQKEISPNSDEKEQKVEEPETKLATSQPTSSLNNNHKGIYWGLGLVSLVLISVVVVIAKKRKLKT